MFREELNFNNGSNETKQNKINKNRGSWNFVLKPNQINSVKLLKRNKIHKEKILIIKLQIRYTPKNSQHTGFHHNLAIVKIAH